MSKESDETEKPGEDDEVTLSISPEQVCFIIVKAREFDVKDIVSEPDPGSNPSDDNDVAVLEKLAAFDKCASTPAAHRERTDGWKAKP